MDLNWWMNLKKLAGKIPNNDRLITSMAITMAVRKTHLSKSHKRVWSKYYLFKTFPGRFTLPWFTLRSWLPTFFNVGGQRGQEDYEYIICLEAKCTSWEIHIHCAGQIQSSLMGCAILWTTHCHFDCSIKSKTRSSPAKQEVWQKSTSFLSHFSADDIFKTIVEKIRWFRYFMIVHATVTISHWRRAVIS